MTNYLSDIEALVRAEVERETAVLRAERDRAISEAEIEGRRRQIEWREAHVQERINAYKIRAYEAEGKLENIAKVLEVEGTVFWERFNEIREILGVE